MRQRRKFSGAFKAQIVLEVLTGVKTPTQLCREHGIKESLLCRWRQEFLERAPRVFEAGRGRDPCQGRIAELERMVGRLTMELE
ncbi:MAG: transposase, partial [Candidatus Methanosuratincola sp.]|nr:transposase [Candidatus Methanosuratincola sp.]